MSGVTRKPLFSLLGSALSSTESGTAGSSALGKNASSTITSKVLRYVLYGNFYRNNTHFTLTAVKEPIVAPNATYDERFLQYLRAPEQVRFAISTGVLGFRKAARGEYEAAFQTTVRAFQLMDQRAKELWGHTNRVPFELKLNGFGKGRQAFAAALSGPEGSKIRERVVRITDRTPLKFGGVRSPRPRRL